MTNEELYDSLLEKGFDGAYINQVLKSREAGYDIYNTDLPLQTDKIREYRNFLLENIEPVFTHGQLREIELGWMKGLNVFEYTDPKYTKEQMCVIRKALEHKKDVSLIKEYGRDAEEMSEINRAISNGLTKEDFNKYTIKEIKLFNQIWKKRKIDIRHLIDQKFSEDQILTILNIEKKHKGFSNYINSSFSSKKMLLLAEILDKFQYEDVKEIFNSKLEYNQIKELKLALESEVDWKKLANPKFDLFKMRSVLSLMLLKSDEDFIDKALKSEFSPTRWHKISYILQSGGCTHNEILFDKSIPDDKFKFVMTGYDLELFRKLVHEGYCDAHIMTITNAAQYGIKLLPYVKPDTTKNIFPFYECLKFIDLKGYKNIDKQFLFDNINDNTQVDLFKACIMNKIDYTKINYDISLSQLNQVIYSSYKDILAPLLKPSFTNSQINALRHAVEEGINISNLLIENLDSGMYGAVLKLEKFNAENERKINIKELLDLNLSIKELGPLIGKLTSTNLEDNLLGYKQISTYQSFKTKEKEPENIR